ncbi:MAG TPA: glycosyltransferase [Candidatus Brocadiia bacterium]|nr:glycosyltransferase [Candidatus Brocadiia bacterium]
MPKLLMAESTYLDSPLKVGCHHYSRILAEAGDLDIFYLSTPFSPLHFLKRSNAAQTRERAGVWRNGPVRRTGNLLEYVPFTLLPIYNRYPLSSAFACRHSLDFTMPSLGGVLRRSGFAEVDALLLSHPLLHGVRRLIECGRFAYRVTDDITEFPEIPQSILEAHNAALREADVVVTTSRNLACKLAGIRGRDDVHVLPNGVDLDVFRGDQPEPEDLAGIPHPRAVYVGAIDSWFDVPMLEGAARALPNVHFVLIGPVRIPLSQIESLPNMRILGRKPYADIPAYLRHSDVGIIPFARSQLVDSVSPIKLFEYAAAGLPIVSRRWKELELLEPPATLVDDSLTMAAGIRAATERPPDAGVLSAFAEAHSWRSRAARLREILFPQK